MPVQPAALELLAALSPVLARWGRWYVFGAQAVIVYGVPRLSADVDVTLALDPDDPERFAGEMDAAGFALRADVEDARTLWRLHGPRLDAERVRRTLGLLEEALGQSDLVPRFESIGGPGGLPT